MAYLPPHKRHSGGSDPAPPTSSLRSLSISSSPRGRHQLRPSNNKIIHAVGCVSRWSPLPPFSTDSDDAEAFRLEPFACEPVERKTGAKPLVLSLSSPKGSFGSPEAAAAAIAERFLPELLTAAERARATIHDAPEEEEEVVKLSLVARVGKVLFQPSNDGASNMRGEWNGLQAKFMEDCPYAYYVHCFAHQLQLALVGASKEVTEVHNFFDHLALVVNTVVSSSKRNDEFNANQVAEMEQLIELGELETGRGANQIGTLKRPCDTRWSSHYASVCSLIKRYGPTFLVLKSIATATGSGSSPSARAKAAGAVRLMMSFDFVFILHVMKELMGITDMLCRKLQSKNQDIVNAMDDVLTTKKLIQRLRDDGWSKLIGDVMLFCQKHRITAPKMTDLYVDFIRSRTEDESTAEHHYRYDVFTVAVDQQAHELNCRFSEQATEILILCNSLDPSDSFSSLKIDDVCSLASKYYSDDFSEQEINNLRCQLQHYELDVPTNPRFQNLSSVAELCQQLAKTGKSVDYNLIDSGASPVSLDLLRNAAKAGKEGFKSQVRKSFYTNVPSECLEDMEQAAVNLMGLEFDSSKEHYHVKIFDKHQSDSTMSCKCTVQEDGKLAIHKVELNQIRQLVEDISCLSKDLDLRLMLSTKRILKNVDPEVENAIQSLVSSAILDPNVKGGLRWPLGKESIGGRFSIVGVWHTNYKAFRNRTLRFKLRHADRFDHRSSTGEVSNEVTFKLTGISNRLQDGNKEAGTVKEMLESTVRMIWDSALCYNMAH